MWRKKQGEDRRGTGGEGKVARGPLSPKQTLSPETHIITPCNNIQTFNTNTQGDGQTYVEGQTNECFRYKPQPTQLLSLQPATKNHKLLTTLTLKHHKHTETRTHAPRTRTHAHKHTSTLTHAHTPAPPPIVNTKRH